MGCSAPLRRGERLPDLLVYLGSIALLPDTHREELLFALTAALLLVSLRALLRFWLRQRRSAPAAP